tara:strand:+ start:476 stop:1369 length:894 start_codon:yes stop_codon:yes gene_type:complete
MRYFPKSSINILEASLGELVYKNNNEPYVGVYIETDGGKYYEGSDTINLGPELKKPQFEASNFGNSKLVRKYNLLQERKYVKLGKYKTIIPSKTRPTEKDYEKGYMFRYFIQRANDELQIFEVSKKTFEDFDTKYDTSLYTPSSLTWTLEGNVRKANKQILEKLSSEFRYIKNLFPLLNEFESMENTGNLFTAGGELYYENGREYTGPYHIHSENGPMVGAKHTEQLHEKLTWAKDLQSPRELKGLKDLNYEKFLKDRNPGKSENNVSRRVSPVSPVSPRVPQRPSSPSSGGGRGGY